MAGGSASITSSARMTANGSSPISSRATSTACPRPSGSPCLTYAKLIMFEILRISSSCSRLPRASRNVSSSTDTSKWSSIAFLPRPVTRMMLSIPEATASSTPYWMRGLSTSGSISLGCALVAGRNRVPSPAAGKTALRTFGIMGLVSRSSFIVSLLEIAKQVGRCQLERVIGKTEGGNILQSQMGVGGETLGDGIDYPDVGDAPGEVFFELLHNFEVAVVFG